jgi:hypothetical protein
MDKTPNLQLPFMAAAQSQKHVTHNEALRALDAIVQLSVLDRTHTAPPEAPVEGARYIVAPSATGGWTGHDGHIAALQDGAWAFYAPPSGWLAWDKDAQALLVWDGAAWVAASSSVPFENIETLGINATPNATNRLAVAAAATLLSNEGGDHRVIINKATVSDTASVLYETDFSGRAEVGLVGDDDLHVQVSPDGSTWQEAMVVDNDTGAITVLTSCEFTASMAIPPDSTSTSVLTFDPTAQDAAAQPLYLTYRKGGVTPGLTNPNNKWNLGYNIAPNGLRVDTSDIAMFVAFDTNYGASGSNATGQYSFGAFTVEGDQYQLYSMEFPYSNAAPKSLFQGRMQFNRMSWQDRDDTEFIAFDWGAGVDPAILLLGSATKLQIEKQDAAGIVQRNHAGTGHNNLPFTNARDELAVEQPLFGLASKLTVNNALVDFTLSGGATFPTGSIGFRLAGTAATGANVNPWKTSIDSTGTVDFTSWNLGGGNSYFSAWVSTTGGDAAMYFNVNGGGKWTAGLDNSDDDSYAIAQGGLLGTNNALRLDRTTLRADFGGPAKLKSYTVATLPSASTAGAGALVYVSDASGGPTVACSDGTNWRVVAALGAVVS